MTATGGPGHGGDLALSAVFLRNFFAIYQEVTDEESSLESPIPSEREVSSGSAGPCYDKGILLERTHEKRCGKITIEPGDCATRKIFRAGALRPV